MLWGGLDVRNHAAVRYDLQSPPPPEKNILKQDIEAEAQENYEPMPRWISRQREILSEPRRTVL